MSEAHSRDNSHYCRPCHYPDVLVTLPYPDQLTDLQTSGNSGECKGYQEISTLGLFSSKCWLSKGDTFSALINKASARRLPGPFFDS